MEETKPSLIRAVLRGVGRVPHIILQFAIMIIPCILVIQIFEKTGIIIIIAKWFAPVMSLFKLPGEAALALITAQFSVFSGIAAASSLNLTAKQLTIVFTFSACCHNIFLESAVAKRVGVNMLLIFVVRLLAGVFSALIVSVIL